MAVMDYCPSVLRSSMQDISLPFSMRTKHSFYPSFSMKRASSIQSISRATSVESSFFSGTTTRQRSRSREGSAVSLTEDGGYKRSSYSWRNNFNMNITSSVGSRKLSSDSIKDRSKVSESKEVVSAAESEEEEKESRVNQEGERKVKVFKVGEQQVRLKEVKFPAAPEDRSDKILEDVRKQRRALQSDNATTMKDIRKSGWRLMMSKDDNMPKITPSETGKKIAKHFSSKLMKMKTQTNEVLNQSTESNELEDIEKSNIDSAVDRITR